MNNTELKGILDNHKKWCDGECGGQRADLQEANLQEANLRSADLIGANLRSADLRGANLRSADLRSADLIGAGLRGADLRGADLRIADLSGADLRSADLRGANLDFSVWPLWCGSKQVKVDRIIASQLAAHFCALDCADKDYIKARDAILEFAQSSHIAKDLEV